MARKNAPPAPDDQAPVPGTPPSGYTVLARRYRPQQFADLIGQEPAAQALVNALKSGRVAHAYLFTGARGVGKTSTARILAKALNCVQGPTPTPCDRCEICQGIASGEDVDVLEIDGASNRRIDEIRDIRSNVQYRPARGRYKIYIIDEVHMLTREAFNALLKTLEEPPPHVKFIFATTEVDKVPITILSRCQRFDFSSIGTARIAERLRGVVASEGLEADNEALELVARRAGGSMRDAQSLLDQLLAFGGQRLTADAVHRLLGTADDDRVVALVQAAMAHDPKTVLRLIDEAAAEGLQLGELVDQLIGVWRDLMVLNCTGGEIRDLQTAPRHRETLANLATGAKLDTLLAGLDILSATRMRLRGSSHGRVLVEMALVRLARLDDLVPLAQLAHWLNQSGGAPTPRTAAPTVASARNDLPPEGVKKKPLTSPEAPPRLGPVSLSAESLPALWQEVLTQVGPIHARQLEKAGMPAIFGPNALVLRFSPRYNAEREYCQESTRIAPVEELLRKLTGHPCQLRLESAGGSTGPEAVTELDKGVPELPRTRTNRNDLLNQEPMLKRAADLLGAQIVHRDEDFGAAPTAPAMRQVVQDDSEEG